MNESFYICHCKHCGNDSFTVFEHVLKFSPDKMKCTNCNRYEEEE